MRKRKQSPQLGEHQLGSDQRERTEQRNCRRPVQWGWRRAQPWRPKEGEAGVLIRVLGWAEVREKARKMRIISER